MDAGKVIELLDRVLKQGHHDRQCIDWTLGHCGCGAAEVERDAEALVAELRAEAAKTLAPWAVGQPPCKCFRLNSSRHPGPHHQRQCGRWQAKEWEFGDPPPALLAAVEGAPKFTARCGRAGPCACPMEVSDLTGRSA